MNKKKQRRKSHQKSKYLWIMALTAVILLVLLKAVVFTDAGEVRLLNQGVDLLLKDQFHDAEAKFGRAFRADPELKLISKAKNPSLSLMGVANAALEGKDVNLAAKFYLQSYEIDSAANFNKYARFARKDFNYPEGLYIELGNLFWNANNLTLAQAAYERPLISNPDLRSALTNLGNIARRKGDYEEAMKRYNRALAVDPSSLEARVNMAGMAMTRGDAAALAFHLEKLDKYHPEEPLTILLHAQLEQKRENYKSSMEYYTKYLEKRPADLGARLNLIEVYSKVGESDKAQELLKALALQYGARPEIYDKAFMPAEEAFSKEDYAKAKSYYEEMAAIWPNDDELKFGIANCMIRLNQIQEAHAILSNLLERHPQSSAIMTNLGIVFVKMGKLDWAKEQFEAAIEIDEPAYAYYDLGKVWESQGDTAKAYGLYMSAMAKDSKLFDMSDLMMNLKMQTEERIAKGDTAGMIFLDKNEETVKSR